MGSFLRLTFLIDNNRDSYGGSSGAIFILKKRDNGRNDWSGDFLPTQRLLLPKAQV